MPYENASYTQGSTFAIKQLLHGDDYTTRKITVLSGQNLIAGTVIGKITATGKYKLSLSASADGSEVPDQVLATDCDASAGDKEALVFETADLNANALTIGTAHTLATIREGLRVKGITING